LTQFYTGNEKKDKAKKEAYEKKLKAWEKKQEELKEAAKAGTGFCLFGCDEPEDAATNVEDVVSDNTGRGCSHGG
jgi:hypothetical protein